MLEIIELIGKVIGITKKMFRRGQKLFSLKGYWYGSFVSQGQPVIEFYRFVHKGEKVFFRWQHYKKGLNRIVRGKGSGCCLGNKVNLIYWVERTNLSGTIVLKVSDTVEERMMGSFLEIRGSHYLFPDNQDSMVFRRLKPLPFWKKISFLVKNKPMFASYEEAIEFTGKEPIDCEKSTLELPRLFEKITQEDVIGI